MEDNTVRTLVEKLANGNGEITLRALFESVVLIEEKGDFQ